MRLSTLLGRPVRLGLGVRAVRRTGIQVGRPQNRRYVRAATRIVVRYVAARRCSAARIRLRRRASRATFASIVLLSWNAPEYTKAAIDSIRDLTRSPHEIIVVDNGSGAETIEMLRRLTDVRVIYNATN